MPVRRPAVLVQQRGEAGRLTDENANRLDAVALYLARLHGRKTWAQDIAVRLVKRLGVKAAAKLVRETAKKCAA